MLVWRPVFAGHLTLSEVKSGAVSLEDVLKINAMMDARENAEAIALADNKGKT